MGVMQTIMKFFMFVPLMTGPIMIACGLDLMECPAMLCKANSGTGPDKFEWAAGFSGLPVSTLLIGVGVCKVLAILDIYFFNVVPQLALVCVAIMMGSVTFGHLQVMSTGVVQCGAVQEREHVSRGSERKACDLIF